MLAGGEHHRLDEHAEVRPLAEAHLPVDGEKHRYRRIEKAEVPGELPETPGLVLAGNANRRIHILSAFEAAGLVRLCQALRIDVVFRALAEGIVLLLLRDDGEKFLALLPGYDIDMPGLQIAAGGRVFRLLQNLAHGGFRHRLVKKGAAGDAAFQGFGNFHRTDPCLVSKFSGR